MPDLKASYAHIPVRAYVDIHMCACVPVNSRLFLLPCPSLSGQALYTSTHAFLYMYVRAYAALCMCQGFA